MSLKENLEKEANEKGLTGEERHRFIGGTIHKIEAQKASPPTPKQRKHTERKTSNQAQAENQPANKKPLTQAQRDKRNAKARERRLADKKAEEERKQRTRTVVIKGYTDHEIEQFKKQLAVNKERIQRLQERFKNATPDSYEQVALADKIYALNRENDQLNMKIHSTIQTSYARYQSHYLNHSLA